MVQKKAVKKAAKKAPKQAPKQAAKKVVKKRAASATNGGGSAAQLISARIAELGDWRGKVLARVRRLILAAAPGITEEWKWSNPVWSHHGIVCTGESYKSAVKLTFARGASLSDPAKLFTSSLEGNVRRAVDIRQDDDIDEAALKELVRAAVFLNLSATKK